MLEISSGAFFDQSWSGLRALDCDYNCDVKILQIHLFTIFAAWLSFSISGLAELTEAERNLGVPEDFPRVGSVYSGLLYDSHMMADFKVISQDPESKVYSGEFTSHRVTLPMDRDPEEADFAKKSGPFTMVKDATGIWQIYIGKARTNAAAADLENVRWIKTNAGPALVGSYFSNNNRQFFLMSPEPDVEWSPYQYLQRTIIEPEVIPGGTIKKWKVQDGLANNGTRCLAQTADGAIWIGTIDGLSRFDGSSFDNFLVNGDIPLPDENIKSLCPLADGRLAVGTKSSGFYIFDGKSFQFTPLSPEPNDERPDIGYIIQADNGDLWLGNSKTVYWLRTDGSVVTKNVDQLNPNWCGYYYAENGISSIVPTTPDTIFIAATGSLIKWNPLSDQVEYCKHFSLSAGALLSLNDGTKTWITPYGARLVDEDLNILQTTDLHLRGYSPSALTKSLSKGYWSYIRQEFPERDPDLHGLFHTQGKQIIGYEDFPKEIAINKILEDREGNLWVGTPSDGLMVFKPPFVRNHAKSNVLSDYFFDVTSQHQRTLRKVKMAAHEADQSARLVNLSEKKYWPEHFKNYLVENPSGITDIFLEYHPLGQASYSSSNSRFHAVIPSRPMREAINAGQKISPIPVMVEYTDSDKTNWYYCSDLPESFRYLHSAGISQELGVYLATEQGVLCLRPESSDVKLWSPSQSKEPFNKEALAVWVDSKERVWIGTEDDGVYVEFTQDNSASIQTRKVPFQQTNITTVYEDSSETIWISSPNSLSRVRFEEDQFETVTRPFPHLKNRPGKPKPVSVVEDENEYLWYGLSHGIQGYRIDDLSQYMDRQSDHVNLILVDENSGLKNASSEILFYPGSGKGENGNLYFNMLTFEVEMDPAVAVSKGAPPTSSIKRLSSYQDVYFENPYITREDISQLEISLPPEAGRGVNFDFSIINLNPSAKSLYTHRLVGHSDNWSPLLPYNSAFFPSLKPGPYKFEVKAAAGNGQMQATTTTFRFRIEPYFYQTTTFKSSLGVITVFVILAWVARLDYCRKQALALEKQQEIEKERLRITQDLHDDLGSSLARFRMRLELAMEKPGPLDKGLAQELSNFAKDASTKMREIIWYLNPETCSYQAFCDYLSFLVTDYLKGSEVSVRLKITDSNAMIVIGSTMKRLWVNIIKNLLSNVVQYSKASAIEFELREINQEWVEIKLIDNGIGFDTSYSSARPDSTGLKSIQSRVTSLNGEFRIESLRGKGTSVTIKMPISDP